MLFVYREFLAKWIKNTLSDSIEEAQTEHDVYLDPRKYPLHESNFYLAEASGNFDLHDQFERKKNQINHKNIVFVFAFVVITFSFPGRFEFVFVFLHIVCHYVYFLWNSVYFTVLISYVFILFLFFMIYFFISNFFQ